MTSALHQTAVRLADPRTPWFVANDPGGGTLTVHVRGYARLDGREWRDEELATQVLQRIKTPDGSYTVEALRILIPRLNGCWALVAEWADGKLLAAVDRVRCIPLFYRVVDSQLFVGDDPMRCVDDPATLRVNATSALEYLLAGYVTNGATLYEGLQQVRAGEWIEWNPADRAAQPKVTIYYGFCPNPVSNATSASLAEEFEAVSTQWFTEFAQSLKGERIVVPLSGGLDSRFVAAMLKRVGVENVLCFTYGVYEDDEVTCSRAVAEALEYPWRYVQLDERALTEAYRDSSSREYWRYGAKFSSMPLWQDFPVVRLLAREGYAGPDTIYFPGLTGDMIAGGHLPPYYEFIERRHESAADVILRRQYDLWPTTKEVRRTSEFVGLQKRIHAVLAASPCPQASPAWQMDRWDMTCRQAYYINNSLRAYEFFDARWRTMWDHGLMNFFAKVPVEERFGRRFYLRALRDKIFTGQLAELTQIPLAGRGKWNTLESLSESINYWSYKTLRMRQQLGRKVKTVMQQLSGKSKHKSYSLHSPATQLRYMNATSETTIGQVLDKFGGTGKFPLAVQTLIEHRKHWPVFDLSWLTIFSSAMLCNALASND